MNFEPEMLKS